MATEGEDSVHLRVSLDGSLCESLFFLVQVELVIEVILVIVVGPVKVELVVIKLAARTGFLEVDIVEQRTASGIEFGSVLGPPDMTSAFN